MNTIIPPPLPRARNATRSVLAFFASALAVAAPAQAAEWHLAADQLNQSTRSWNSYADWKPFADGTGTSPTALFATDTYYTNGKNLRTPIATGTTVFPGAVLAINGGELLIKSNANGGISVPKLVTTAGVIRHYLGVNGLQFVQTADLENRSGTTSFHAQSSQTLRVTADKLTGVGRTRFTGGGTFPFTVPDAMSYTGELHLHQGLLDFDNAFSSAGALVIETGAKLHLDQTVTFTKLVIAGVEKPLNTYTAGDLQSAHPGVTFTGTGSIVVRPPLTWYLSTSQTTGADWRTVTHWRSNADGTGITAPSINPYDTYVNQVSARTLRTPDTAATFAGKTLRLTSGGKLLLSAPAGQVSTVPLFETAGAASIGQSTTGVVQTLAVDDWVTATGTTTVAATTGGTIELIVNDLTGSGNLAISGPGKVVPFVKHATHHTGTVTVNSGGTLKVPAGTFLATAGALVVNSGGAVELNDWLYCTSLTVNGVVKAAGVHDVSTLPGFSSFNGSKVVVYTRDLAGPPLMYGVNLAGAEFAHAAEWQDNAAVWDYYQSKKLTLIRMPVKWSRIQTELYGEVDFSNMDRCIALARERGMKVIIDLHNYGAYLGGDEAPRVGSTELPISAFTDVWTKIAEHYAGDQAIYGYDIMNEPIHLSIQAWSEAAQKAVEAIRKKDQTHYVLVEGIGWSNASNWSVTSANNGTLDIRDPAGRLIYSAHSYWDYKMNGFASPPYYGGDGIYRHDDVPDATIGIDHVAPFVEWLKTRPYAHGNIGEYAIPNDYNVAGWEEALDNFLTYIRANNISATYWAGGENWLPDNTVCHPQPFPGPDKSQMAILSHPDHVNAHPLTNVFVDNMLSSTSVTFLPSATAWTTGSSSTVSPAFIGNNYQYNGTAGASAKFTPTIHVGGMYEVLVRWSTASNRSASVPVTVVHANGTDTSVTLNQKVMQSNAIDGWNPIGTYAFNAGTGGSVTLSVNGTGLVIADSVWFRPVGPTATLTQHVDVGSLSVAGTSSHNAGAYTLTSAGTIYGTADAFRFVYQDVTGDCTLTARVVSQTNTNTYARAGVMIRDGLGANAAFADAIVTPSVGAFLQYRTAAGDTVTSSGGLPGAATYWVQIKRVGNVFSAYKSATGAPGSWVQMGGNRTITMGSIVKVGLVACSFTTNTQSTVVFDNVTLTTP